MCRAREARHTNVPNDAVYKKHEKRQDLHTVIEIRSVVSGKGQKGSFLGRWKYSIAFLGDGNSSVPFW